MAYSEKLNNRIREALADHPNVEEKYMFGGSCFMVHGKMCVGVAGDEMMCRIGPDAYEDALQKTGCREMVFTGKPMKGYVFVGAEGMKTKKDFNYWIGLCLNFNTEAKASKKKRTCSTNLSATRLTYTTLFVVGTFRRPPIKNEAKCK